MSLMMPGNRNNITPMRVGVVGAGNMGQHHLRVYSMLSTAKLVGVVDVDGSRAKAAAIQYNCAAYGHLEDLVGKVDAVSIAVPSHAHAEVGEFFLNHGIHCLIEKPLAVSEEECLKLIKIAEAKGVILLVGHVEHFNPAVLTLSNMLKHTGQVYSIEAKRMGWNVHHRLPGVDVILDLMVHDLEITSFLHDHAVLQIAAQGICLPSRSEMEQVTGLLTFASGTIASLTSSWISAKKIRTLEVNTEMGMLSLDYSTQKLLYYRHPAPALPKSQKYYQCEAQLDQIFVRYQEPLMLELQNFLQSIDAGVPLGVNGYQALNALKLAWKIQTAITKNKIIQSEKLSVHANL